MHFARFCSNLLLIICQFSMISTAFVSSHFIRRGKRGIPIMSTPFENNQAALLSTNATDPIEPTLQSSSPSKKTMESLGLAASRLGRDPCHNHFAPPIVYHERYSFAGWPSHHTFPMQKFERIAHALQTTTSKTVVGSNLPRPIVRAEEDFFRPLDDVPVKEWIASIINPDFVERFLDGRLTKEEARRIGFREQTHRPELIERTVLEVAGTVLTAQLAYHYGIAANVAGGTHHASPDGGAGYTIFNDLAVTANFLTNEILHKGSTPGIERVLVIDCDVHQGDGTAKFSTLWNDNRLATLSIHCASNYPHLKANSTYDIGLRDNCNDDEYLEILEDSVNRALSDVQPNFVLYDAGVDVYIHDKLGRLKVTEDGIRKRDRFVLEKCVGLEIPVAAVVGGGYDKDVDALARRHAIVHEEAAFVWRKFRRKLSPNE
mmetsp:Transcript_324/g.568  ORF Transcript_324/g.568 Transcript_324/m.568 type:complete len:432 (+) Transcript_324:102-1397(+)